MTGDRLDTPTSPACTGCYTTAWGRRCLGLCSRCYQRAYAHERAAGWLCAVCAAPLSSTRGEYCAAHQPLPVLLDRHCATCTRVPERQRAHNQCEACYRRALRARRRAA